MTRAAESTAPVAIVDEGETTNEKRQKSIDMDTLIDITRKDVERSTRRQSLPAEMEGMAKHTHDTILRSVQLSLTKMNSDNLQHFFLLALSVLSQRRESQN